MSEEYINTRVRPILELLLDDLLDSTPEDPIPFMYTWLLKYRNKMTKERLELENLREQIKEIRKKDNSIPLENYNSILSNLKNNNNENSQDDNYDRYEHEYNYSSESEEEENLDFNKIEERRQKLVEKGQRTGISAEAYGRSNKKKSFVLRVIKKQNHKKKI